MLDILLLNEIGKHLHRLFSFFITFQILLRNLNSSSRNQRLSSTSVLQTAFAFCKARGVLGRGHFADVVRWRHFREPSNKLLVLELGTVRINFRLVLRVLDVIVGLLYLYHALWLQFVLSDVRAYPRWSLLGAWVSYWSLTALSDGILPTHLLSSLPRLFSSGQIVLNFSEFVLVLTAQVLRVTIIATGGFEIFTLESGIVF